MEEGIIKRKTKTNTRKLKNGKIKESKTEVLNINGIGIKSKFKDNEKVVIIKKEDLKSLLEKERKIKNFENTILELQEKNHDLQDEIQVLKRNMPKTNNRESDLLYDLLLNNSIEQAIKIISEILDSEINESKKQNIETFEKIFKNLTYNVDKQNEKIKEVQKGTIENITNLDNQIANYNKEIHNISRFKLLFEKNKLNLCLDTSNICETFEKVNNLEQLHIDNYNNFLENLLIAPNCNIDVQEVKKEVEKEITNYKQELEKNNINIIDLE